MKFRTLGAVLALLVLVFLGPCVLGASAGEGFFGDFDPNKKVVVPGHPPLLSEPLKICKGVTLQVGGYIHARVDSGRGPESFRAGANAWRPRILIEFDETLEFVDQIFAELELVNFTDKDVNEVRKFYFVKFLGDWELHFGRYFTSPSNLPPRWLLASMQFPRSFWGNHATGWQFIRKSDDGTTVSIDLSGNPDVAYDAKDAWKFATFGFRIERELGDLTDNEKVVIGISGQFSEEFSRLAYNFEWDNPDLPTPINVTAQFGVADELGEDLKRCGSVMARFQHTNKFATHTVADYMKNGGLDLLAGATLLVNDRVRLRAEAGANFFCDDSGPVVKGQVAYVFGKPKERRRKKF